MDGRLFSCPRALYLSKGILSVQRHFICPEAFYLSRGILSVQRHRSCPAALNLYHVEKASKKYLVDQYVT